MTTTRVLRAAKVFEEELAGHIVEKTRHRPINRRKRHSGQGLLSMTGRKYAKTHIDPIKGSQSENYYVPGFRLKR